MLKGKLTTIQSENIVLREDHEYPELLSNVKDTFEKAIDNSSPLVITDCDPNELWLAYLNGIPEYARQEYNCRKCRQFIERYGSLAIIDPITGVFNSVLWDDDKAPDFFKESVKMMKKLVDKSRIKEPFITSMMRLGQSKTGKWNHFSVDIPQDRLYLKSDDNDEDIDLDDELDSNPTNRKVNDFKSLTNSLEKYSNEVVSKALHLLKSDSLDRTEKFLGKTKWFKDLHDLLESTKNVKVQENWKWLATMTAPSAFCRIGTSSSVLSTLFDDIKDGVDLEVLKIKFAKKVDPTKYQRPVAKPSEGNKKRAEQIFAKKPGLEKALERRFAKLDEIEKFWTPKKEENKQVTASGGIFSHLASKQSEKKISHEDKDCIPKVTSTWVKFRDKVLPDIISMEVQVSYFTNSNFTGILTAVDSDAPAIIQWDNDKMDKRNPFSWYCYAKGSSYRQWNIESGWNDVNALTYQPSMWNDMNTHYGEGVIFIIDGCRDTSHQGAGIGLFPEIMKSGLHEIRATIEAYSKEATLQGEEEASACGLMIQNGGLNDITLRVKTALGTTIYHIDRWD